MLISDPISDMFIRLKNALLAKKEQTVVPHSKMKEAIILKLKENKYIQDYEVLDKDPQKEILVKLRYVDDLPAISGLKRISSPGRRLYAGAKNIPLTLNHYGITLLSTNQGILTDAEAREKNVGGELMFQVW